MAKYWPPNSISPAASMSYSPLIHRLMCTNEPPLDKEVSHIYTIFQESPQHLSQLDEAIGRTCSEDVLAHLRRKRSGLALFLTDKPRILSHVFSPVRRVPAELISEIALHALHRYTAFPIPVSLTTRTSADRAVDGTAWTLAQVCRSWRSNLISFSKLWSVVEVKLPTTPNSVPIMAELLRRSGSSLLHLTFDIRGGEDSIASETVDLCLGHADRWKDLRITDYSQSHQTLAMFNTIKNALPRLESLFLLIHKYTTADRLTTFDAFECAPRLKAVVLELNEHASEFLQIPLPWQQLKRYSAMGYSTNPLINPLQSLSNLSECCLHGNTASFQIPVSRVRFPLIRSLEVYHLDVLSHIIVPKLERLRIWSRPLDWTPVAELIDRSACDLQSLIIIQNRNAASLSPLLRLVPNLISFETKSHNMPSFHQLLSSLLIAQDTSRRGVLLPKLQHLTVVWALYHHQSHEIDIDAASDLFIRMVESRLHIPIPGDDLVVPCLRQIRFELVRVTPSRWQFASDNFNLNSSGIHVRDLLKQLKDVPRKFDDLEDRLDDLEVSIQVRITPSPLAIEGVVIEPPPLKTQTAHIPGTASPNAL